eukprot:193079_1
MGCSNCKPWFKTNRYTTEDCTKLMPEISQTKPVSTKMKSQSTNKETKLLEINANVLNVNKTSKQDNRVDNVINNTTNVPIMLDNLHKSYKLDTGSVKQMAFADVIPAITPMLQIIDVNCKECSSKLEIGLSDGLHYIHARLIVQSPHVKTIKIFSVIKLKQFVLVPINYYTRDCVITQYEVIDSIDHMIGNPECIITVFIDETKIISFLPGEFGMLPYNCSIDISKLAYTDKKTIIIMKALNQNKKYTQVAKYATLLLNSNAENEQINFLYAIVFTYIVSELITEKEHNQIEYKRHYEKSINCYKKILDMQPNNHMYLLQFGSALCRGGGDLEMAVKCFCKLKVLFHNKLNEMEYPNNLIEIEISFQFEYLRCLVLQNNLGYHAILSEFNELYSSFDMLQQITRYTFDKDMLQQIIVHKIKMFCRRLYLLGYSKIGEYNRVFTLLQQFGEQSVCFGKNGFEINIIMPIYLEMGKYTEAHVYTNTLMRWSNIFKGKESEIVTNKNICLNFVQNILLHGYICLLFSKNKSKLSTVIVDKMYKSYHELMVVYNEYKMRLTKELYHSCILAVDFMKVCLVLLFYSHDPNKQFSFTQMLLKSIKVHHWSDFDKFKLGESSLVTLFQTESFQGGFYGNNVNDAFPMQCYIVYILKLIADKCNKSKYVTKYDRGCFLCLQMLQQYASKFKSVTNIIFMHPCVALSYLEIGTYAYNHNLFQVSLKFLKKSMHMGKDLILIKNNCKKLIMKCSMKWKTMKCSNCGIKKQRPKCCKGCCEVFYCNKSCQKIDWKNKHRNQCTKQWLKYIQLLDTV